MEVMVINELRLDFMDPKSQDTIVRHMREFLCLDGMPPGGPPSGAAPTDGPLIEGAPYNGPGSATKPSGGVLSAGETWLATFVTNSSVRATFANHLIV